MDPVFSPTPMPPQPSGAPTPQLDEPDSKAGLSRHILSISLAILALIVVAGAGAYWWTGQHHAAPATDKTGTSTQKTPQVTPDTVTASSASQYVSNGKDLNLSFSYPSSWTVTPPTNTNASDQAITVTSPLVSIADAADKSVTARVTVSIRPGGSTLTEFASGKAIAGQASAQIGYDKPTAIQHQYPFLTYIHLAGAPDPSSAFEEVIVTGITSFAKDQSVSSISLGQLDPVISARFYSCGDQTCDPSTASPLDITNSTWISDSTCAQALAIFKSLQIN